MDTPDYQTIRIWTRTLKKLRLAAALRGERMAGSFHYCEHLVDSPHADRRTGTEFVASTGCGAGPALAPRPAPSVAGRLGPRAGGDADAVWRPQPVRHRPVGAGTPCRGGAGVGRCGRAPARRGPAAAGVHSAGCGGVRDGADAGGAGRRPPTVVEGRRAQGCRW